MHLSSFKQPIAALLSVVALSFSTASAAEVYSGEPLGEALYDLAGSAILIADKFSSASALVRTDVFRMSDGRLLLVTSRANKLGEPFSIEALRVTASGGFQIGQASSNRFER